MSAGARPGRPRFQGILRDLPQADADDAAVRVVGPLEHHDVAPGEKAGVRRPQGALEAIAERLPVVRAADPACVQLALDPVFREGEELALRESDERLDSAVERRFGEARWTLDRCRDAVRLPVTARVVPELFRSKPNQGSIRQEGARPESRCPSSSGLPSRPRSAPTSAPSDRSGSLLVVTTRGHPDPLVGDGRDPRSVRLRRSDDQPP